VRNVRTSLADVTAGRGGVAAQTATTYVVVLKGTGQVGVKAVQQAGGQVVKVNKLGIAQVSSTSPSVLPTIRKSGAVEAAANNANPAEVANGDCPNRPPCRT
jgi:hypothetical protein